MAALLNQRLEISSETKTLKNILDRTRALAGVFQAAALVRDLASNERFNSLAYETTISSVFQLNPESISDIYGDDKSLSTGLNTLEAVLKNTQTSELVDTIRYALGLIHVESMLQKQNDLLDILRQRVERCVDHAKHFDSVINDSVIAQLADIYLDTMGTFKYRIQVKGDAQILQQENYANRVRAIFLAGVRSAMLWRQLGGKRWHLMFFRKRELEAVKSIIDNQ